MIGLTSTLDLGGLTAYIGKVGDAEASAPREMAFRTAALWRFNAHRLTGAYRSSIYVRLHDSSDYSEHSAAASALNPSAGILPEVPRPARKAAARVASCVDYAEFEEYGTSRRPAHPAFRPAIEQARREYPEITRRALRP